MTAPSHPVISPKKLIEVALPLEAINDEGLRRKRKAPAGYPTALHKWWAQRPVASARAVIFCQLVNDPEDLWRCQNPSKQPSPQNKAAWTRARSRLFRIVEDLIKWDNTNNPTVFAAAKEAIADSWRQVCELNREHPMASQLFDPNSLPGFRDPFAGGGTIPLEAKRLGLVALASDLNPVAVLINKAMIEIPPRFADRAPVHPSARKTGQLIEPDWKRIAGLVEDVRHYGQWMRDEAEKRIGHLYPKVKITQEMAADRPDLKSLVGEELMVIAWFWARTVKSPNPAFAHIDVPLASSFVLSSKAGKEAYVQPVVDKDGYRFTVKVGKPPEGAANGTTAGKRQAFRCLLSQVPIDYSYIRSQGKSVGLGQRLMAIVAEGKKGRIYLSPIQDHVEVAAAAKPKWRPEMQLPDNPRDFKTPNYGLTTFGDLFTSRQLVAHNTFIDLLDEITQKVESEAIATGFADDKVPLEQGGGGALAYAQALRMYSYFVMSRSLHYMCSSATWLPKDSAIRSAFGKQALPMVWDYAEGNPLTQSSAGWAQCTKVVTACMEYLPCHPAAVAVQADAATNQHIAHHFISTDPPYYDNIGYADLSDFFYVWLRRALRSVFPTLLATIAVPKREELVATPYRHGDAAQAERFFLDGMTDAMRRIASTCHPAGPISIYYAFKESETTEAQTSNTGWETFLEAVVRAGLSITGTWPMRTESDNRQVGNGTNSLASSIVLVCRSRREASGTISRRQFVRMLNETLPQALDAMTRADEGEHSPVAPVDLSQAIIGPGMAIFSRYDAVLEADGTRMSVKTALQLINRFLAEDDFDADTQFCLAWFDLHCWESGKFGEADTLARAKGTTVDGVKQAGVAAAGGGNVRLLRWRDYADDWDPATDARMPIWEALHQLIRAYKTQGELGAAQVLAKTASKAETIRQLAYRLYTLCERKGQADEARSYNEVVTGWGAIEGAAAKESVEVQGQLFDT